MAELLSDDAQFITVNGAWTTTRDWLPRPDGSACTAPRGPFRSSTRKTAGRAGCAFLAADVAMMHSRFYIAGEVHGGRAEPGRSARASASACCASSMGAGGIVATQNTDVRLGRRH